MKQIIGYFFLSTCSLLLFLTGCGSGVEFTGTVKYADGAPCGGAYVCFLSEQRQYDGTTDANGVYSLMGATPKDGIEPGSYRVTVTKRDSDSGQNHVSGKYASAETSGLTCEVKGSGTFDITLEQ